MNTPNLAFLVGQKLRDLHLTTTNSLRIGISLAGALAVGTTLQAQDAADTATSADGTDGAVYELDEFTVMTSDDQGYYSAYSTSATRTNALVKNTPISMTIINEELMDDLAILNDEDLARVTASVTRDPDGFSFNQIRIRGFRSLTQRFDLFWREIERDGYNIQRVDIVKGANSLIYGQADPGGKVNSVPKEAMYGSTFNNLQATFGNKDFQRFELDSNLKLSDDLAVRVMAFDHSQEFDSLYEYRDLKGATVDLGYRLNSNIRFRLRYERMDTVQNLQPDMFRDATQNLRYKVNSLADETDTQRRPSLTAYRNEFLFNQDVVSFLPQAIIDDLELVGNTDPTRADIAALYEPWTTTNSLYSSGGPDKLNDRVGDIYTFDYIHKLTDSVQLKVSFNREDDERYAFTREGYSGSRVKGAVGEEYIDAHWQIIDGGTVANAVKATLLWETGTNDLPLLGLSKHNLLLGYDWDQVKKNPRTYDQLREGTTFYDGNYFTGDILKEQLPLANGFGPDAPGVRFNGRHDLFHLRKEAESDVVSQGFWAAIQSEFLDGRLRTLLGIRYDDIEVTHSYLDHAISVIPEYFTNPNNTLPEGLTKETINVEFADNDVPYDQVSPSIGALYWITDGVGVFANYAQSIQSPDGTDLDPFGDVIPPVYGEGYEYGLRFDLFDGKLNGQIIAFYIEKENDNVVNYDFRLRDIITYEEYGQEYPNYFFFNNNQQEWRLQNDALPGRQVAGDISRAEGLDVEFYYNPTRSLSFVFSYTYNNLDAIKINENVNERFGRIFGLAPHNAIIHLRYKFFDGPLTGFAFGLSQSYRSSSTLASYYIDDDDEWYDVELDEEFVTDGFIRYETKIGSGRSRNTLSFTYRVQNLFNERDLLNRNQSASYRESIRHQLEVGFRF